MNSKNNHFNHFNNFNHFNHNDDFINNNQKNIKEELKKNILYIEEEIKFKLDLVNQIKNIQKYSEIFAADIFSFYYKIAEPILLKKSKFKKDLDILTDKIDSDFNTKIKSLFSLHNITLNEFLLKETNMKSIDDLKLKYNNTDTPIILELTFSNFLGNLLSEKTIKPKLRNHISSDSIVFFNNETVHLYIKNNKMYFRNSPLNSRALIEDALNSFIDFNGELVNVNYVAQLSNGDTYNFFIDKKINFNLNDLLYFLDNI